MSDADYLKGECQKCGGCIEFPASGVGELVVCPHCGEQTKLVPMPVVRTLPRNVAIFMLTA
jgi:uncharacterized paraquat-inducible protein A